MNVFRLGVPWSQLLIGAQLATSETQNFMWSHDRDWIRHLSRGRPTLHRPPTAPPVSWLISTSPTRKRAISLWLDEEWMGSHWHRSSSPLQSKLGQGGLETDTLPPFKLKIYILEIILPAPWCHLLISAQFDTSETEFLVVSAQSGQGNS